MCSLWERAYEQRVASNTKVATLRVLRQAWQRIERSELGLANRSINKVFAEDVQKLVNSQSDFAGRKSIQLLGSLFADAQALGFDGDSWVDGVRVKGQPPRRRLFLTASEVEQLAGMMEDSRHGDTIRLLAYTGLRVGELSGLQVRDWDSSSRRLYVQRNASFAGGKLEVHTTKTSNSVRSIPVPKSIAAILDFAAGNREAEAFLWTSPDGFVFRPGNFRRRSKWMEAVTALGFEELRLHDLRHTYASLARQAGADLPTLSSAMGHGSYSTTVRLYGGIYASEFEALANGLEEELGRTRGKMNRE